MSQLETEGTDLPYRQVTEKRDTFMKKLYFLPGYVSEWSNMCFRHAVAMPEQMWLENEYLAVQKKRFWPLNLDYRASNVLRKSVVNIDCKKSLNSC